MRASRWRAHPRSRHRCRVHQTRPLPAAPDSPPSTTGRRHSRCATHLQIGPRRSLAELMRAERAQLGRREVRQAARRGGHEAQRSGVQARSIQVVCNSESLSKACNVLNAAATRRPSIPALLRAWSDAGRPRLSIASLGRGIKGSHGVGGAGYRLYPSSCGQPSPCQLGAVPHANPLPRRAVRLFVNGVDFRTILYNFPGS